ncbi:MscL family protein [Siccirubricoccus sp. G192]|uniref:MscL family protein n=1 Tax=Siccirubricoccus sp. G192 TaxID=2849651 RepID=UPI0020C3BBC1|nr:MscL family protein [Siccirubricoccus sp. G192]
MGLVVGAAFTTIVTSLVEDLINPLIGLAVGGVDFSNIFLVLSGERRPHWRPRAKVARRCSPSANSSTPSSNS